MKKFKVELLKESQKELLLETHERTQKVTLGGVSAETFTYFSTLKIPVHNSGRSSLKNARSNSEQSQKDLLMKCQITFGRIRERA